MEILLQKGEPGRWHVLLSNHGQFHDDQENLVDELRQLYSQVHYSDAYNDARHLLFPLYLQAVHILKVPRLQRLKPALNHE